MNIGIYINSIEQFHFFKKFNDTAKKKNIKLIFFTSAISIKSLSYLYNIRCNLLRKYNKLLDNINLQKSELVLRELVSYSQMKQFYSSVYHTISVEHEKEKFDILFVWNGLNPSGLAFSDFGNRKNIKLLFFELSNIHGKLFIDPLGVNAFSSIYENIEILNNFNISEEEYENWYNDYLIYLNSRSVPPQVNKKYFNYLFILDKLYSKLFRTQLNGDYSIINKIKSFIKINKFLIYDNYDFTKNKFIFYPCQISTDTQLIFNSNVNNIHAIKTASKYAIENNSDLVVKIHPGETNTKEIEAIYLLKNEINFYIVNYSTTELLINCLNVFTINSTVGLEGLILNKKVTFLGRTFYSKLNKQYLKNYICSYLIDIDYFNNQNVDEITFNKLLERIINE